MPDIFSLFNFFSSALPLFSVLSKCNPTIAAVPVADLYFVGLGLGVGLKCFRFARVIFFFSSGVLGLLTDLGLGVMVCADLGVVVEPWV